jgi:hypothetical protein
MNSTTGLSSELSLVYFYRMCSVLVILPRLNCTQLETVETDMGPLSLYKLYILWYSFIYGICKPLSSKVSSKAMVSS